MPDYKLISKSVRIPEDVVAFIETKEGETFSEKLLGIIKDYRQGDADRQRRLQEYDALLESKRKQLQDYSRTAQKAARVTQQLSAALRDYDTAPFTQP